MQQIFNFFIRNVNFLLFLFLFSIGIALVIHSHSYHKSKFIHSTNAIKGGIYKTSNAINQYFNLKQENEILINENKQLREQLYNLNPLKIKQLDSLRIYEKKYKITSAEVYKNSYSSTHNYLILNKGLQDGIKGEFGVITSKGIVGIIVNTTKGYSSVLSILSKKSRINAKHKTTHQIGSLTWDGISPEFVQLEDIPKFVDIAVGDTIVTGGQSIIFPKGINIGTVYTFTEDISEDSYIIDVKLFNDMTTIEHVYIIENKDKAELEMLQNINQ